MQTMSWKCLALIAIAMCTLAMAVPVPQDLSDAPNPLAVDVSNFVKKCHNSFAEKDRLMSDLVLGIL